MLSVSKGFTPLLSVRNDMHMNQKRRKVSIMTEIIIIIIIIIMIIIINLIYIAQFDTNGILSALYIVITYIQMQYVHV